jgi:hypothetical protein
MAPKNVIIFYAFVPEPEAKTTIVFKIYNAFLQIYAIKVAWLQQYKMCII